MSTPLNRWPNWPSERGWIGLGTFALTVMVLWMLKGDPSLLKDDFFKTVATAIIISGFISGPVSWAYSATKAGGELAEKNAEIVQQHASAPSTTPQPVTIEQPPSKPVPVELPDPEFAQFEDEPEKPKP